MGFAWSLFLGLSSIRIVLIQIKKTGNLRFGLEPTWYYNYSWYKMVCTTKMKNYCRDVSCFQGRHCKLEQFGLTPVVLLHSPPGPSQHLHTTPSVSKTFENPIQKRKDIPQSVGATISLKKWTLSVSDRGRTRQLKSRSSVQTTNDLYLLIVY